jgi:CheY-like chemotaxis protein
MIHVLIVDDDEDDRDLFCDAVNVVDPSIKCLMARNGEEALCGLKNNSFPRPTVIFLDLNMPRLNGKQCLVALKQDSSLQDIPVVIFTTSKLKEDKDETKRLGAADFVTKPTTHRELCGAISYVLAKHGVVFHTR